MPTFEQVFELECLNPSHHREPSPAVLAAAGFGGLPPPLVSLAGLTFEAMFDAIHRVDAVLSHACGTYHTVHVRTVGR